jgi:hypothetical protein
LAQLSHTACNAFLEFLKEFAFASDPEAVPIPEIPADTIPEFVDACNRHGLLPCLYRPLVSQPKPVWPAEIIELVRRAYLIQLMRNVNAIDQLQEIAYAFNDAGLQVMALKGAAAIMRFYPDLACRQLSDIDLIVKPDELDVADQIMQNLGYTSPQTIHPRTSPVDARIAALRRSTTHYIKPGRLQVELHIKILNGVEVLDLWSESTLIDNTTTPLLSPSYEHFLLHTSAHLVEHILHPENPEILLKGFLDLLILYKRFGDQINWRNVQLTASRWGIEEDLAVVLNTLRYHWGLHIPDISNSASPVPLEVLLYGPPTNQKESPSPIRQLLSAYIDRISRIKLVEFPLGLRYLFHLIFPVPDYMRHRYKIPEGRSVAPYYLIHPFVLVKNFFAGLASAVRASRTSRLR